MPVRITQDVWEILIGPPPAVIDTQDVLEVVATIGAPGARDSQEVLEVVISGPLGIRLTQDLLEAIVQRTILLTQEVLEVVVRLPFEEEPYYLTMGVEEKPSLTLKVRLPAKQTMKF